MMKKVAVISFTEHGSEIAKKVQSVLCAEDSRVLVAEKYKEARNSVSGSLGEWTKRQFEEQDAIIYVGAVGIAVRAIAPYIESKEKDPAVLVIDEKGQYCIPVLSGHIGGANELAEFISEKIGASAVITTATDINHKWAVDVFARKNGLWISDMAKAKEISARLIAGEEISVSIEDSCGRIEGTMPKELHCYQMEKSPDIAIGVRKNPFWKDTLYLVPKVVVLGAGCRKGAESGRIEEKVRQVFSREEIFFESICRVSSIDLKKEEAGILAFCKRYGLEYVTFSAQELQSAEGEFSGSDFVKKITGVDNVCERSAVCGSGGKLIINRQAECGVTVAAAIKKWSIRFE